MVKKTLLVTAAGGLALAGAQLASEVSSSQVEATNDDATVNEPELQADCPWCWPSPDCFPGDPCWGCG